MRKTKTIFTRFVFYIVALQILNLSIDGDHIASHGPRSASMSNFDDIDSFAEYILEKVVGDDHYTTEDDDDNGNPQNNGIEKFASGPLYFEPYVKILFFENSDYLSSRITGLDQANKTCKGYFNTISPPPKA